MAKVAPAIPWWQRLGHHFSGAGRIAATLGPLPPSPPPRQRVVAGLPPPVKPQSARRRPSRDEAPALEASLLPPIVLPPLAAALTAVPAPTACPTTLGTAGDLSGVGGTSGSLGHTAAVVVVEVPQSLSPLQQSSLSRSGRSSPRPANALARHPLEVMAIDEGIEANIELASLPHGTVIVRSQLDYRMRRQKELAEPDSVQQKCTLDGLKQRQVLWRRKHDALLRRKRQQIQRFRHTDSRKSTRSRTKDSDELRDFVKNVALQRIDSQSPTGESRQSTRKSELDSERQTEMQHCTSDSSLGSSDEDVVPTPRSATNRGSNRLSVPGSQEFGGSTPSSRRTTKAVTHTGSLSPRSRTATQNSLPGRRQSQEHGSENSPPRQSQVASHRQNSPPRFGARRASAPAAPSPVPSGAKAKTDTQFDFLMTLARKHNLRLDEVRMKYDQFRSFDINGDLVLTQKEFENVVRDMCGLPADEAIPSHLLSSAWRASDTDNDGVISFEEFLLWCNSVQYTEEMMCPDPEERKLREMARQLGLSVSDIEQLKTKFDKVDTDRKGSIDEDAWKLIVCELARLEPSDFTNKRWRRYWMDATPGNNAGFISLVAFIMWWTSVSEEMEAIGEQGNRRRSKDALF